MCVIASTRDDDDDFCYKRVQTPGMSPPRAGAWTYCLFTPWDLILKNSEDTMSDCMQRKKMKCYNEQKHT